MISNSRAKFTGLLAAFACGLAAAAPVLAQQDPASGPVQLFPIDPDVPDAGPTDDGSLRPQPTAPQTRIIETDSGTITVENLQAVDPNTTGLIGADGAGLGIDMWQGTDRARIRFLIENLPTRMTSPELRDLAHRLLTSAAELPNGSVAAGEDTASLLGLRITKLAQLGYPQDALALYESADIPAGSDPDLARVLVGASLLTGDVTRACTLVQAQETNLQDPYWQKHLVLCKMADNDMDAARFGATLLEDNGVDDPVFYALVSRIADGRNLSLPTVEQLTPLHMGLMWLAEVPLPASAVGTAGPAMLRAIASNPHTDIDTRLAAAEQASLLGAVDVDMLTELYKSVTFEAGELDRPISIATESYDSRSRALLYQAASIESAPETKALIVGQALKLARQNGYYALAVALHTPQVQAMAVRGDLSRFAGEATRLLFAIGRPKPAQAWLDHLRIQAARDPEALLEYQRLWALSRLAGDSHNAAREEADRTGWVEAVKLETQDESGRTAARQTYLAYRLMDVTGREPVSSNAWTTLAAATPAQITNKPNPAATTMMVRATQQGSRAEAVAWILLALGGMDSTLADPDVMVDTIYALRALGLSQDAQDYALEIALANNL